MSSRYYLILLLVDVVLAGAVVLRRRKDDIVFRLWLSIIVAATAALALIGLPVLAIYIAVIAGLFSLMIAMSDRPIQVLLAIMLVLVVGFLVWMGDDDDVE